LDVATGRPSGLAVRFLDMDPDLHRRVEEFALEGFRPSSSQGPPDLYEHRVVERPTLDASDLNRFGRDGWQLVSALPSGGGFKLVLSRKI
jgi:hypothetical protein